MLLRKDLEIIFSSPEIKTDLAEVERLYHKRFDSEYDKTNSTGFGFIPSINSFGNEEPNIFSNNFVPSAVVFTSFFYKLSLP